MISSAICKEGYWIAGGRVEKGATIVLYIESDGSVYYKASFENKLFNIPKLEFDIYFEKGEELIPLKTLPFGNFYDDEPYEIDKNEIDY